ncbi:MAG: protein-glutamate O-methyltransferase CheR [Chloroflexi bacterium]|nr:protein-glutamate O-methyltransferase CheR [Chloroflexota bacterium]MBU1752039.1 protein-glutamate O-methyltransferase CheR [Chloroflexota bacterium]
MRHQPERADEPELAALLDHIQQERGLDCHQYKPSFLRRRLATRLRARKVQSYAEYQALLDEAEYQQLYSALTINLSYFFRDASLFDLLRDTILPDLLHARSHSRRSNLRRLRIWSAGCAGGEEPYSLAILLYELLGPQHTAWQLDIRATDVEPRAIARARSACYAAFSLRGVDPQIVERYFVHTGPDYCLSPTIAAMVDFEQRDLSDMPATPAYDLVLCRNVLIYFARPQQERLFHLFHRVLADDGILVIGKTEVLPLAAKPLFRTVNLREHVYAKIPHKT